jgi:hypothetical protein
MERRSDRVGTRGRAVHGEPGFMGVAVGYRLALSDGATALDCIKDANSAVRWVRLNARELNADPAAWSRSAIRRRSSCPRDGDVPRLAGVGEDAAVSSVPNAVVALAPAVDVGRDGYFKGRLSGRGPRDRLLAHRYVRPLGLPVSSSMGRRTRVLPLAGVERFVSAMKDAGTISSFAFSRAGVTGSSTRTRRASFGRTPSGNS